MQHLLILEYQTDAERKRIDYTIEKWSGKDNISVAKPKGVVVLFDGEGLEDFVEDVYSRIDTGSNPPRIFTLEENTPRITTKVRNLDYSSVKSADVLENFLNYLLAKQSAAFDYSEGDQKVYSVRTRKGQVRIAVLLEKQKNVRCQISIEGYGEVVDFVAGRIDDELKVFLGGV